MADLVIHPKAHQYQRAAVEFSSSLKGTYFMIDMGLGKTLITLMAKMNLKDPILVIAPLRPLYSTWPDEVDKWFPGLRVSMLHGKDKDYNLMQPADVYLINPEGFKWLELKAKKYKLPFKHLCIDEGSMWKDSSTKRWKLLRKMRHLFDKFFILSGTPNPQSLMDLWSQYYILDGGERLGKSIGQYRSAYFDLFLVNNQFPEYTPKPGAFEQILDAVADITFRLDACDHIDLPECLYNDIKLTLPPKLMKKYKELEKEFVLEYGDIDVEAFNTASLSCKLRQFVQGGIYEGDGKDRITHILHDIRIKALKDLIEESGQPILCAIQFRFELDMIRETFGNDVPYIGGGVKPDVGTELIRKWNRKEIPLLVCHPTSLKYGANMQTGGSIVLWYGLTWSLEAYLQLNKRIHRQGQINTVIIHHFVMEKTVDERVARALAKKENIQKAVLDYFKGGYCAE